jgi:hypothetical protein
VSVRLRALKLAESPPDAFGCHRQLGQPGDARIGECVNDRGRHGSERTLTASLGPIGPRTITVFDEDAAHLGWDISGGWDTIVEKRVVQKMTGLEIQFFEESIADPLYRCTLILSFD